MKWRRRRRNLKKKSCMKRNIHISSSIQRHNAIHHVGRVRGKIYIYMEMNVWICIFFFFSSFKATPIAIAIHSISVNITTSINNNNNPSCVTILASRICATWRNTKGFLTPNYSIDDTRCFTFFLLYRLLSNFIHHTRILCNLISRKIKRRRKKLFQFLFAFGKPFNVLRVYSNPYRFS